MPLSHFIKPETMVAPFGIDSMKCKLEDLENLSALTKPSELWRRGDGTDVRASKS